MSNVKVDNSLVLNLLADAVLNHDVFASDVDAARQDKIVPRDLRQFLARLRLLEGVPFAYLAADSDLLPPESIRYFYLDRNWTDALVQGALSVGTFNSSDRAELEQLHKHIRGEIDEEERQVRLPGGERPQKGQAGVITGFLLRSRAVSGWPGMHVRAYSRDVVGDEEIVGEDHPDRIKLLRLERLAPAVMLALFDGIPRLVHLEEPRQGLQFGVDLDRIGDTPNFRAEVRARDAKTSKDVPSGETMPVLFRRGSPGVLDLRRTAESFVNTDSTNTGPALDSAEFALQMIRFPYRQVFGETTSSPILKDVLTVSAKYTFDEFKVTFAENIQ